jgi:ubiquinone/menaquinone biosynthesis C-methylase UbiE
MNDYARNALKGHSSHGFFCRVIIYFDFSRFIMSKNRELAYRYDLFITPEWRDRFDSIINESVKLSLEGRILDVNSGTGSHAIELAERMRGQGEVLGVDPSAERVEIARAKALAKKVEDVSFEQGSGADLRFESHEFDAVIGDASLLPTEEIEDVLAEMIRVAQPDAQVILKLTTRGSFDEFFSIYWEALLDVGIVNGVWAQLEAMINERVTISEAENLAVRTGLREVQSFNTKEEFSFETADDFFESPLIQDAFLDYWLGIIPQEFYEEVRARIISIIERERGDAPFDVSIKATVVVGRK